MDYAVNEIESSYLNISIALFAENLYKIIKKYGSFNNISELKREVLSYRLEIF